MPRVESPWLTTSEFSKRYEVPYSTALKLAGEGKMPGHWTGKQYRFNRARCDSMYQSGELDRLLG